MVHIQRLNDLNLAMHLYNLDNAIACVVNPGAFSQAQRVHIWICLLDSIKERKGTLFKCQVL